MNADSGKIENVRNIIDGGIKFSVIKVGNNTLSGYEVSETSIFNDPSLIKILISLGLKILISLGHPSSK